MSRDHVLSVLDAAIAHVTNPAAVTLPTADGLRAARAAVSELITAADDAEHELSRWGRQMLVSLTRAAQIRMQLSAAVGRARGEEE